MFNKISSQANKLVSLTQRKQSNSKTKVVAITSGKGGVGKSTITANSAFLMAQKGFNVAVLDADIGLANLQVLFDLKPEKTFFDYLEAKSSLKEVCLKTKYKNITLLAGKSHHNYASLNNGLVFSRIVEDVVALDEYDILLIDTGAGINEHVQEFLGVSDHIIAITTTDPTALTDLYAMIKLLSLKKNKLMLCFNHTLKYDTGESITKSIINLAIKNKLSSKFIIKYLGNIEASKNISVTGRLRKIFVTEFEHETTTKQLKLVVKNIINELR